MDLSKILSIAGKPGLFRILNQSRGGVVVESLVDGKRFSIGQTQRVSTLSDISVFTWEGDQPLTEVLQGMLDADQSELASLDHNDNDALRKFFLAIAPQHDTDRVYASDIKKIVKWYQLLQSKDLLGGELAQDTTTPDEAIVKEDAEVVGVDSKGAGEEE